MPPFQPYYIYIRTTAFGFTRQQWLADPAGMACRSGLLHLGSHDSSGQSLNCVNAIADDGEVCGPPEGWHHDHLHWLSEMADLKEHTWVEFDCHHPSNTQKCWNPRYTMTSRQAAVDICKHQGKFMELSLRRRPDYAALEANSWTQMPDASDTMWTSLVLRGTLARELLREMVGTGELLREIDDNVAPSPISELLRQWAD